VQVYLTAVNDDSCTMLFVTVTQAFIHALIQLSVVPTALAVHV